MGASQRSVLIVDDVVFNRQLIANLLQSNGFVVQTADSARQAINLCFLHAFDVILMDVNMPSMDGLEATRQIRTERNSRSAKAFVIGISAHSSEQDRASFLSAGMDTCLPKPIDFEGMLRLIEHGRSKVDANHDPLTTNQGHDLPVLDLDGTLKRIAGNRRLFRCFVEIFQEEIPQLLQELQDLADESNLDAMGDVAHRIRGISANLGAVALSGAATHLETTCRSRNEFETHRLVEKIGTEVGRLDKALRNVNL